MPDERPRPARVTTGEDESIGYDAGMSEPSNEAERTTPGVGLIADEDLPEDLQPTDDNPLAKDPADDKGDAADGAEGAGADPSGERKVEGMPDMGEPPTS